MAVYLDSVNEGRTQRETGVGSSFLTAAHKHSRYQRQDNQATGARSRNQLLSIGHVLTRSSIAAEPRGLNWPSLLMKRRKCPVGAPSPRNLNDLRNRRRSVMEFAATNIFWIPPKATTRDARWRQDQIKLATPNGLPPPYSGVREDRLLRAHR